MGFPLLRLGGFGRRGLGYDGSVSSLGDSGETGAGQLVRRGTEALLRGEVREAGRLLRGAIARWAFMPAAHFNLAVVCRLRGELPLALGHARLAVELMGSAPAHVLYGVQLQLAGARERARGHFERALKLAPTYRLAAMYLGLVHRELGQRAEATAWLERSLVAGPGGLAPLVAERVRGQLFDLRRGLGPEGPTPTTLCAVAVVTEILFHDGTTVPLGEEPVEGQSALPQANARREGATAVPAAARICDAARIAELIHKASKIVVLTGAGASAASGLETRKQLWQRYNKDAAVSAVGVARNPGVLWMVVRDFLGLQDHAPGAVHHVIARLPRVTAIVTQNVDDLHQRAALPGRQVPVFELHGTLERMLCAACGARASGPARDYVREHLSSPPCAVCRGPLRPDVVLFGEQLAPRVLAASVRAVEACDLLLVVGCAMDVAPASELPCVAAARGATVVELKRSPSRISDAVGSSLLLGPAEETLPAVYTCLAELEELPALPSLPPPDPPRPVEPLTLPFVLPPLGESISEVTLARWTRQVGDTVAPGDIIAEVDSDKVTVEIEAPFGGILRSLRIEHAATVRIGEPIADVEPLGVPPFAQEVREAFDPLFTDFGPHSAAVRRGIGALGDACWLRPGSAAELEAQVRVLAGLHGRALGLEVPIEAWFTDDPREAFARWRTDWQVLDGTKAPKLDPVTIAWHAAVKAAGHTPTLSNAHAFAPSGPLQQLVDVRIASRMRELHGEGSWRHTRAAGQLKSLVPHHLRWLAVRGQAVDAVGPFAPLVAIWAAGAWPFVLRGGVMGVYLPFRADETPPEKLPGARFTFYLFTGLSSLPF